MHRRSLLVAVALVAAADTFAQAQPITYPLWATTPATAADKQAQMQFEAAARKRGLGAPEVLPLATPESDTTADLLTQGTAALRASNFVLASALLSQAATQAASAESLTAKQVASIFFYQAVALQAASGATLSEPFSNITPDDAKAAYLRAAIIDPDFSGDGVSPLARASWRLALAEIRRRPTATITVRGHAGATISIDAGMPSASPAKRPVPYGEHLIRVTEPGHVSWSTTVAVAQPQALMDVPATELMIYDVKSAAATARAHGASFALLGQLHLGDKTEIDMRLVDAKTGEVLDSTAVPVADGTESAVVNAAVLRLDEVADRTSIRRRAEASGRPADAPLALAAPPPRIPPLEKQTTAQPQNWFTQHWPLFTAAALAAGTTIVLGIVVAKDH